MDVQFRREEEHFLSGFFDCSVLLELRSDQIIEINPC